MQKGAPHLALFEMWARPAPRSRIQSCRADTPVRRRWRWLGNRGEEVYTAAEVDVIVVYLVSERCLVHYSNRSYRQKQGYLFVSSRESQGIVQVRKAPWNVVADGVRPQTKSSILVEESGANILDAHV